MYDYTASINLSTMLTTCPLILSALAVFSTITPPR